MTVIAILWPILAAISLVIVTVTWLLLTLTSFALVPLGIFYSLTLLIL